MCLFAAAFAVSALYVPGVALLLVALAASIAAPAAARGARVELELSAERVEEGERAIVRARVSGRLAEWCRGSLRVLPGAQAARLGWRSRVVEQSVRTVRRGRVTVGPAKARWADPFQLCIRERMSETRELLVLPRVQPLRARDAAQLLSLPDARARGAPGLEFDGLRPPVPGAPASRIHWLTAARTGTPMERRFCEESDRWPVTIALDARAAASEEALDAAVRAAASLCAGLGQSGGCSAMLPGLHGLASLSSGLDGWAQLHEALALVEDGMAPRWELAREAHRLVLVQARTPQPPPGLAVSCFVSPVPDRSAGILFSIAGCAVQPARGARMGRAA
jgi:uncharacterized protein (DUF58 family)